jgi:hypothetical protein
MRILVNDANILIDLVTIGLVEAFGRIGIWFGVGL